MEILGWIIAGLIVGALARLFMPGKQPMGLLMTIGLGIAGSIVGGAIGWFLFGDPGQGFRAYLDEGTLGSWIMAVLGGVLLLALVGAANRQRRA
jgi:uncharacterized membrane protein YeaQ/YmgE (transglycosylase-associated protein family)